MDYVRHPSISAHNIGIREVAALLVETSDAASASKRRPCRQPTIRWCSARREARRTSRRSCSTATTTCSRRTRWSLGQPAFRADHPRRAHLCARHRRQQGPALRPAPRDRIASGRARRRCPATSIFLLEGEEEIGSPHIADFVARARGAAEGRSRRHLGRAAARHPACRPSPSACAASPRFELRAKTRQPRRAFRQFRRRRAEPDLDAGPSSRHDEERRLARSPSRALPNRSLPPTNYEREAVSRLPLDLDAGEGRTWPRRTR